MGNRIRDETQSESHPHSGRNGIPVLLPFYGVKNALEQLCSKALKKPEYGLFRAENNYHKEVLCKYYQRFWLSILHLS